MNSAFARVRDGLMTPIDNGALVAFRIAFGVLLVAECVGAVTTGWVDHVFLATPHTVTAIGFEWLQPLPRSGMHAYYYVMAAFGAAIAAGAFYRLATSAFVLMWLTLQFMQTSHYNNHHYLMLLLCGFLLVMPANARASWDARRRPELRATVCPRWCHLAFLLQFSLVYFYAGVAKLDPDWLAGRPVGIWFDTKVDWPVLGPLYASELVRKFVVFGGLAFDLTIVPLLLWRRSRPFAVLGLIVFHTFNTITFQVPIFALTGIASVLFFFPPDIVGRRLFRNSEPTQLPPSTPRRRRFVTAAFLVYFAFQFTFPLRHHFIPGHVSWTEEGHRMAWRMMLISKRGRAWFEVHDPETDERWTVHPSEHLGRAQAAETSTRPNALWKFVQYLDGYYAEQGRGDVEIYGFTETQLNGRAVQSLVDSTVDLSEARRPGFGHADWILPIEPLPPD